MSPKQSVRDFFLTLLALAFTLAASATVLADDSVQTSQDGLNAGSAKLGTVRVYYHDAAELADRLNMMFEPNELKASGLGQDLILRASSEKLLHDAKALVADLDSKPAQFRISIREAAHGSGRSGGLNTSIENRHRTNSSRGQTDVTVSYGDRNYSTGNHSEQTVTVLEGNSVSLTAGQLRPVQNVFISNNGIAIGNSGQRELVGSDLLVTPTLAGPESEPRARVSVAVRNQRDSRYTQSLDAFELASTQLLPLGEWTPLGGSSNRSDNRENGNFGTSYSTRSSEMTQNYEILIQLLP